MNDCHFEADARRWLDERFRRRPEVSAGGDPAPALDRWRAARLADLLEWAAAQSPWYRRLFDPGLVRRLAADLRKPTDDRAGGVGAETLLAELPTTSPADLAGDSDAFLAVGQDEVAGLVSIPTSGTSGPVKRIRSTAADLQETVEFFIYGMRFLVEPGRDRVALAMSAARPGNVGDLLGRALAVWNIPFLAHGFVPEEAAAETAWLEELADWGPTCLVGVPPQMLALSRHEGTPRLARSLKTILLSGDVAEDALVAELEANFGAAGGSCRVYRHYGLTEIGLGGAVECGQRLWPHLRDDLWVEILGPDGRPVAGPGRAGEITVTPLTRRGMPLIRYRTGDEGFLFGESCPCGSVMPRLKVFGRLADRFTLPGGRNLRVADFEAPLTALPFVRGYDLQQHRSVPGGLTLRLLTTAGVPEEAPELAAQALRSWLGPDGAGLRLAVEIGRPEPDAPADGRPVRASGGKRRLLTTDEPLSGRVFRF